MKSCSANKSSIKQFKKDKKQKFSKTKSNQSSVDRLLSVQQDGDKVDGNKMAKDGVNGLGNSSQHSICEQIPPNGLEIKGEKKCSSLLTALKTLYDEKGNNSELLRKLFDNNFKSGPAPLLSTEKWQKSSTPVDAEDSDDDDELVEYVYTSRRYFIYSACEFCKAELKEQVIPCTGCNMTFYCSIDDMKKDRNHNDLCAVLRQIADRRDGCVYSKLSKISPDDYRAYRVMTMNNCEQILQRPLEPFEREIIIFPRNCVHCKEWRSDYLTACAFCGQVFCKTIPPVYYTSHQQWCTPFSMLRKLIMLQHKNGKVDPHLPTTILKDSPTCKSDMREILKKINADDQDECFYAATTQVGSAPLTAWYGLKLSQQLQKDKLTIHLIGAEMQFEGDVMQKWELFLLHITPVLQELNVVFVGPELVPKGISLQPSIKNKVCSTCHKNKRTVNLYFVDVMYHDFCLSTSYKAPNLICFFNPGLYRTTGFNSMDSWPATIKAASKQKCPILVTSYTEYESPLDFQRFVKETDRPVNVVLPPVQNPFSSCRPERNFISDEMAPLIFKNFYIFVVE